MTASHQRCPPKIPRFLPPVRSPAASSPHRRAERTPRSTWLEKKSREVARKQGKAQWVPKGVSREREELPGEGALGSGQRAGEGTPGSLLHQRRRWRTRRLACGTGDRGESFWLRLSRRNRSSLSLLPRATRLWKGSVAVWRSLCAQKSRATTGPILKAPPRSPRRAPPPQARTLLAPVLLRRDRLHDRGATSCRCTGHPAETREGKAAFIVVFFVSFHPGEGRGRPPSCCPRSSSGPLAAPQGRRRAAVPAQSSAAPLAQPQSSRRAGARHAGTCSSPRAGGSPRAAALRKRGGQEEKGRDLGRGLVNLREAICKNLKLSGSLGGRGTLLERFLNWGFSG
ncbi:uncharacterized protein [Equus caballus]|uniref:uncharacterized protein n=1 Tax=Equus caballus TaxID=9796 RepID=UPI0038B34BF0